VFAQGVLRALQPMELSVYEDAVEDAQCHTATQLEQNPNFLGFCQSSEKTVFGLGFLRFALLRRYQILITVLQAAEGQLKRDIGFCLAWS